MQKKIVSIFLWVSGALFFFFSFLIIMFHLFFFSRKQTYQAARRLFSVLIRLMGIKLTVSGRENINGSRTYIFMGNHQSLFDIFVIPAAIPSCFVGVEAAYHFNIPVWGYLIRKWGCIPIKRDDLKKAVKSLDMAAETLKSGMSIAILPEGHRTVTGEIASFKKGPFHLAKEAKADILPFAVAGLFNYHPKSSLILNPGRVGVNIGRPILHKDFKDFSVEKLREHVFQTIKHLHNHIN